MTKLADLHIHTHFSDGTSSPEEVVEDARRAGLNCIAITDHDTTGAVKPTQESAQKFNIEVIGGIELSTEWHGKDIHILGYLFDETNQELCDLVTMAQNARVDRMVKMIEKLKNLGIKNIELDEVCVLAKSKSVGRPHLASLLIKKGWVSDMKGAFDKYLQEGGPAYVGKFKITPFEAISLMKRIGGLSVLAHPMITHTDELIPSFVEAGLDGLEVYYPNCPDPVIQFYEGIAQKYNLLLTGGSDAHGQAKKHTYVGKLKIPYELVEKMKEKVSE